MKYLRDNMLIPHLALSDLIFLLAVGAILLLITAELSSPSYGLKNLVIEKKKLRNAGLVTGTLFLIMLFIRVLGILLGL